MVSGSKHAIKKHDRDDDVQRRVREFRNRDHHDDDEVANNAAISQAVTNAIISSAVDTSSACDTSGTASSCD